MQILPLNFFRINFSFLYNITDSITATAKINSIIFYYCWKFLKYSRYLQILQVRNVETISLALNYFDFYDLEFEIGLHIIANVIITFQFGNVSAINLYIVDLLIIYIYLYILEFFISLMLLIYSTLKISSKSNHDKKCQFSSN